MSEVESNFDKSSGSTESPVNSNCNTSDDYCSEMDRMMDEGCPNF